MMIDTDRRKAKIKICIQWVANLKDKSANVLQSY